MAKTPSSTQKTQLASRVSGEISNQIDECIVEMSKQTGVRITRSQYTEILVRKQLVHERKRLGLSKGEA